MMNWLTNIPISTLDIDRKRLAAQKTSLELVSQEKAEKPEPEALKSSYTTTSYASMQSSLGQAADIAVFGFPIGVFR